VVETSRKPVVVTGASTGIGWGAAKVLIQEGFHVFGSVRRPEDAGRLSTELGTAFTPLLFDVTDRDAVQRAAATVASALDGRTLFGLVNNAGIAVPGPLLYLPIDEFRRQIDVNLTAQVSVTQAFAPLLGADRARTGSPGRIVMISSVGGRNATPFVGAYNASKFGLEGMSEALRRELMLFGIDVIIVAPGAVVTPIWDKAMAAEIEPYLGTPYGPTLVTVRDFMVKLGRRGLSSEQVGRSIHRALTVRSPKVRYTVVPNPVETFVALILPKRVLDRIIAKRLGFSRHN
jgi:NAD(P)-dependent dehydrogenase (short-subunit alcohol dehydrogenase family)